MILRNLGKWRSLAQEAWNGTSRVAKFLCLLHVTNNYLCTLAIGIGPSMVPTLNITGDIVLCERVSPRLGKVGRGDIVLVRSPDKPRNTLIKRVVGIEGDQITYVVDPMSSDRCETTVVPKGHIWIEGDNTYVSKDSRYFGAIPYGLLQAKALGRVWPLKDFGALAHKEKVSFPNRTLYKETIADLVNLELILPTNKSQEQTKMNLNNNQLQMLRCQAIR